MNPTRVTHGVPKMWRNVDTFRGMCVLLPTVDEKRQMPPISGARAISRQKKILSDGTHNNSWAPEMMFQSRRILRLKRCEKATTAFISQVHTQCVLQGPEVPWCSALSLIWFQEHQHRPACSCKKKKATWILIIQLMISILLKQSVIHSQLFITLLKWCDSLFYKYCGEQQTSWIKKSHPASLTLRLILLSFWRSWSLEKAAKMTPKKPKTSLRVWSQFVLRENFSQRWQQESESSFNSHNFFAYF